MKSNTYINNKGFSFLELTITIVVISILGMVAISRTQTADTDVIGQYEILKSHLRYAQAKAMNSDSVWGIEFLGSQQYRLFQYDSAASPTTVPMTLPGEADKTMNLATHGVSVFPADKLISFDSWGRPCEDDAGQTPLSSHLTLTLSGGSSTTKDITITRNTGFIP
jgi:MSHA pilin protein MshC